jgi:hypothetical protein
MLSRVLVVFLHLIIERRKVITTQDILRIGEKKYEFYGALLEFRKR